MTRLMYDGIRSDAAFIPVGAQLVAGYVDGLYAWSAADWARFPDSVHVEIAVSSSTNAGIVLDVEAGDATPAQSVGWVLTRRAAGADPSVYCNNATWPQVRAAFQARGVREPHYWIALYDGVPEIPADAVAKQYENTATWDLTAVAEYWPGVDPAPQPAAPAAPVEDDVNTTSIDGRAGLSWPEASRHAVQVTYDGAGFPKGPALRVVLLLTTGALELYPADQPWQPSNGSGVIELGANTASARGIVLEAQGPGPIYDACAV